MDGESVFGSSLRDRILALLLVKDRSYVRELAEFLGASVNGVAKAVRRLESDGLVVAVAHGRTRVVQLNPRWYAKTQLRALLERMVEAQPELARVRGPARSRPRRSGKAG